MMDDQAQAHDARLPHGMIARRSFEISLTSESSPEENWKEAEAELLAELRDGLIPACLATPDLIDSQPPNMTSVP